MRFEVGSMLVLALLGCGKPAASPKVTVEAELIDVWPDARRTAPTAEIVFDEMVITARPPRRVRRRAKAGRTPRASLR